MIGILDYGMGNLGSVTNACAYLSLAAQVLTHPEGMEECRAIVLPGVGAFGDCMDHLQAHGFVEPVKAWIAADRPFLGICLGLQVLFEGSDESPEVPGLGVFSGRVVRFPDTYGLKVPQIGWNEVRQVRSDCPLFRGIPDGAFFYFVHSYYVEPAAPDRTAGVTDYGREYASVVWRGRAMAVQFHPEKSQRFGLRMLENFAEAAGLAPV